YGEAVRRRDALRRERGHGKWRAMLLASWTVFRNLRRHRFRLETPDGTAELRSPFLVVGNNRYSGHVLDACLRPRLDEGRLWIYSTPARGHWSLLRLVFQALLRRLDDASALDIRAATEASVSVRRGPLHVACDGEAVDLVQPLRFRIRPGALHVLAPLATAP
ncbi:MAG TPA: hypothetical protein VEQ65_04105, partial [Opitutus sp.]|nr:hypothetical protein [Opitutus sp.]